MVEGQEQECTRAMPTEKKFPCTQRPIDPFQGEAELADWRIWLNLSSSLDSRDSH